VCGCLCLSKVDGRSSKSTTLIAPTSPSTLTANNKFEVDARIHGVTIDWGRALVLAHLVISGIWLHFEGWHEGAHHGQGLVPPYGVIADCVIRDEPRL
jgi:hypothetical protein